MTWIYMSDLALGLPLYSRFEGLPKDVVFEDGEEPSDHEGDLFTPPTPTSAKRSWKSSSSRNDSFIKMQESLCATVGKLENILSEQKSCQVSNASAAENKLHLGKRPAREIMSDITEMNRHIDRCQGKMNKLVRRLRKYADNDKMEMGKFVKMYKEEIEVYMQTKQNLLDELKAGNKVTDSYQSKKAYSESHLINLLLDDDSSSDTSGDHNSS
jgi:hypothetical protein